MSKTLLYKIIGGVNNTVSSYSINGKEISLSKNNSSTEDCSFYENETMSLTQNISDLGDGLFKINRKWKNLSTENNFVFFVHAEIDNQMAFSLIPCVMYNENKYGNNNEPKGFRHNGTPWQFSYSRSSLPSATISECTDVCFALFANSEDEKSLISSCSLYDTPTGRVHRIYYPDNEAPISYTYRDEYSPATNNSITLKSDEEFEVSFYVSLTKTKKVGSGVRDVYNNVLRIFDLSCDVSLDDSEVWKRGISYSRDTLLKKTGDKSSFTIGTSFQNGELHTTIGYEIGWCGQNALLSRALIQNGIINDNKEDVQKGIEVLDTWVGNSRFENGLVACHLSTNDLTAIETNIDTCNLAWASWQMLSAYEEVKKIGIDKPDWLEYSIGICDFFVNNFSESFGFGKTWTSDGKVIDTSGTIGVYLTIALLKAYEFTEKEIYAETAKNALVLYYERDLKNFVCTAGALDTCCVDKETCWPFLNSALTLYEIQKDEKMLEIALSAAYYILTWTYLYDVPYKYDCDFNALGYRTKGATAVSVQHHHLDPWGALMCGDFERLYHVTKEEKWNEIAKLMWSNSLLCIAGENLTHKGNKYPYGAQNEAYFHTYWGFRKSDNLSMGACNTWFVSWPSAFRLHTLMEKRKQSELN